MRYVNPIYSNSPSVGADFSVCHNTTTIHARCHPCRMLWSNCTCLAPPRTTLLKIIPSDLWSNTCDHLDTFSPGSAESHWFFSPTTQRSFKQDVFPSEIESEVKKLYILSYIGQKMACFAWNRETHSNIAAMSPVASFRAGCGDWVNGCKEIQRHIQQW